jgi:hypothetical protein
MIARVGVMWHGNKLALRWLFEAEIKLRRLLMPGHAHREDRRT